MIHLLHAARKTQLVLASTLALALSACAEPSAPLELGTLSAPVVCNNRFVDFDDVYSSILSDVLAQPASAQPFLRYVGLPNRFDAGACLAERTTERQALRKLVNSLSLRPTIVSPIQIDTTIYRIDMRSFGWNRAVSVPGLANFNDVWEALAAANPYAVEFEGDDAESTQLLTGTSFPFMFSDSLLHVATGGDLYYALLGIPSTRDGFLQGLGINRQANLANENMVRAGTLSSAITNLERLAERHEMQVRPGRVWLGMNFESSAPSIAFNPLSLPEEETFAIYSLPNGLHGYATFGAQGTRFDTSDLMFDTGDAANLLRTPVSCMRCHAQGFLPIVDDVREFALEQLELSDSQIQSIVDIYPEPSAMQGILDGDSAPYRTALRRVAPDNLPDPISAVFDRYQEVTLETAAGDLLMETDAISGNFGRLDPALQALANGTLDREDWNELYLQTLCILSVAQENRPTDAACSAAGL